MDNNKKSIEDKVSSGIVLRGLKGAVHTLVPFEGQRYYCKHTDMPKSLAVVAVTAYQLVIYTPVVLTVAQLF